MTLHVRTLFIDRDGVINCMRPDYVKSWDELELLPGSVEAIAEASRRGLQVIVLTNQSAIGRGLVSREVVDEMHQRLSSLVRQQGGEISAYLVCPHTPEDKCDCRKPAPGLFQRAAGELGVNLAEAVMVGDQASDIYAAEAAGCAAVLAGATEEALGVPVVPDLRSAVDLVTGLPAVSEAVILCGGLGTRLRGVLGGVPKPMAVVRGRPFLEWLLLGLAARGTRRAVLAVGHGAEAIRTHFAPGRRLGIEIAISEEPTALGTGGAARLAADSIRESPLLVMNGDSYCRYNNIQLALMHQAARAQATLWLQPADRTDRFGSVAIDATGAVTAFHEKVAGSGLISAGVYLLEDETLTAIPSATMVSLERDVFPELVGRGLYGTIGRGPFIDIGTPESLEAAQSSLAKEFSYLEKHSWTSA